MDLYRTHLTEYIYVVFRDMIVAFFQQGQNDPDFGMGEKLTLFVKSIKLVSILKRMGGDTVCCYEIAKFYFYLTRIIIRMITGVIKSWEGGMSPPCPHLNCYLI